MRSLACAALTSLAVVACSGGGGHGKAALTPAGNAVTLSTAAPEGCQQLGEVIATGEADDQAVANTTARIDLRNRAGFLGADRVQIMTNHAEVHHGESRVHFEIRLSGKALKCGNIGKEPEFLRRPEATQ